MLLQLKSLAYIFEELQSRPHALAGSKSVVHLSAFIEGLDRALKHICPRPLDLLTPIWDFIEHTDLISRDGQKPRWFTTAYFIRCGSLEAAYDGFIQDALAFWKERGLASKPMPRRLPRTLDWRMGQLLGAMSDRPAMYLQTPSLTCLYATLQGFAYVQKAAGVHDEDLIVPKSFAGWLRRKSAYPVPARWDHILLAWSSLKENAALLNFFPHFREFLRRRCRQPRRELIQPAHFTIPAPAPGHPGLN